MHLYSLTIQKPTAIYCSTCGYFSGGKLQEIAIGKGRILELIRPDPQTGKIHTIITAEVFGCIRSLMAFKLPSSTKDYLVIGSDSGKFIMLQFNTQKNIFEKVHQETFGKSGSRRIVPGQYLASDPKGRAVMIGALEKQKFVYIFNRDSNQQMTISSPLEAHKSHTIVYSMIGLDVGFDNPLFACLEIDYEEADIESDADAVKNIKQVVTYYELDLGLNHVIRKSSEPIDHPSNLLLPVPSGSDCPGGVLVCCENFIIYKNSAIQKDLKCAIPRRKNYLDNPEKSIIIVSSTTHKTKNLFFFLVQTDLGDIFRITLVVKNEMVVEIMIKYFDTVPVCSSMCVLKTGFLFCASEFKKHGLYQIVKLGDSDEEPVFSSSYQINDDLSFYFQPRSLKNLLLVDELESLSPIIACQMVDSVADDTTQLYAICGRSKDSSISVLRHGLEVSEMAVSELPGVPSAVWTVKKRENDPYDAYIIVSFINATLVLSIGETVEEITDSGFLGTSPTIMCGSIGEDSVVQIYSEGIRHIKVDKRVNEWRVPGKKIITKCAINNRQIIIALNGSEIVYFEMDQTGRLNEYTEHKNMPSEIVCLSIGPIPVGEQRSRFLAVALKDNTVRIVSLAPNDCLQPLSMQALPATAESLCIIESVSQIQHAGEERELSIGLFLHMGLSNGVLLRTVLDPITGDLADTRTRYLGSKSVKLFTIKIFKNAAVLAVSSKAWLGYHYQTRYYLTPLSYELLEYSSSFASEQCSEGIVAISGNTLRILSVEKLGTIFDQTSYPLQYTPRKLVVEPLTGHLIIVETDHNTYTEKKKMEIKTATKEEIKQLSKNDPDNAMDKKAIETFLSDEMSTSNAESSSWASLIRVFDARHGKTVLKYNFEQDVAAVSLAICKFIGQKEEQFLLVGTSKGMVLNQTNKNRSPNGGEIYTFKICFDKLKNLTDLQLLHTTTVEYIPGAISSFHGRALIGVGKYLRIYEMGKKKLLKKCENKKIPSFVMNIDVLGSRIIVHDGQESFHFIKFNAKDNQLVIFCDDTYPRYLTCGAPLDYSTMAGADKFGNFFVIRLPTDVTDKLEDDPTGVKTIWDRGSLNGAPQKAQLLCSYFVGEHISSMQKAVLIPGGSEAIIFTTLSGSIGMMVPFTTKEDIEFFQMLEMHLRQDNLSLCGRDHLWYRSSYFPCKAVVDGDLCEQFNLLDSSRKQSIAIDMDRTPAEISKKLEDMRTRYAF